MIYTLMFIWSPPLTVIASAAVVGILYAWSSLRVRRMVRNLGARFAPGLVRRMVYRKFRGA